MPIADNYLITKYISNFVVAYNNYNKNNRDRHERKTGGGGWRGTGGGGGDDTPLAANDFFEGNIGKTFERRSVARNYGFSRAHKYHLELN